MTEPEKRDREMYVANLPEGLTPNDVTELMNAAMKAILATVKSGDPIVASWLSTDQNHAFLEFRTPQEARNAIKLDGLSIMGKVIEFH